MKLPQTLVKRSLESHSWLGVMVSALMYVVCLSGTLLVFHAEFEQWEQADAPHIDQFDMAAAERTFNAFVQRGQGVTPHMYLVLPTEETPHARLATENESWFFNEDGSLGDSEDNAWSTLLLNLHLYLHLPHSWGMLLVSALGAILVGLIISGFLAHPSILRDAFRLRQGSSAQLAQTDLHNRLSVWAAPFHLTIAITGAYFGLSLPLMAIVAEAEFDGDREQVVSLVFGEEPKFEARSGPVAIKSAIDNLRAMDPAVTPFNVIVHDVGSEHPLLEIYALHPQRLIWGEAYQFSIDGEFQQKVGWSDGSAGQQILYSIYRLHFGTFGGLLSKALYFVLGLALTIVAATGTNIWLEKRRKEDGLSDLWVGIVWGAPIALVFSALLSLVFTEGLVLAFWLVQCAVLALCLTLRNTHASRQTLRVVATLLLLVLTFAHVGLYGSAAFSGGALSVNVGLVAGALSLAAISMKGRGST